MEVRNRQTTKTDHPNHNQNRYRIGISSGILTAYMKPPKAGPILIPNPAKVSITPCIKNETF